MAGSREGWEKSRQKLLERYGGEEGLRRHQSEIGTKGGKATYRGKRGFASLDHDKLTEISSKGGRNSRTNTKALDEPLA